MAKPYAHTQIGYFLLFAYSVVIALLGLLVFVLGFGPLPLIGMLIVLVALCLFATLTVSVGSRTMTVRFGPGVIRKSFRLEDIETVQAVKNPWYYGWGIRYTPRGWLYSVSGLSAIELKMKSGKTCRIGTDDPTGLTNALGRALRDP